VGQGRTELETEVPRLRRFARGLTGGDAAAADDLVQEALLRALDRWMLRRPGGNLRAWLFTIVWRRFLDSRRSAAREHRYAAHGAAAPLPVPIAGPDETLEAARVLALIDRLPEDQRAVLLLVAVEGLEYGETAAVLGVPVGTVMSRLSRARDRLRDLAGHDAALPHLRRIR